MRCTKSAFTLLLCICLTSLLHGQDFERIEFGPDETDYYLVVEPSTESPIGALVLMPGFGQNPESVFPETTIPSLASDNNILTIIIAGGPKLQADKSVTDRLNAAFRHVLDNQTVPRDQFVIGGFSAGGSLSLRYAEMCHEKPADFPISPKGVFTVDSPVDLIEIWKYMQREIKRNYSEVGLNEANFVSDLMQREIGTPEKNPDAYAQLTPFDVSLDEPGNEQFLMNMAVRVHHDIDVNWLIDNRRRSLYDTNALQASELINRLVVRGNERAEFMQATSPGYRSNGMRHPHSWSIVDAEEFVGWVKATLN